MEERRAHHLLYEQPHGCSIIRRENDKEVRVDIPGSTVLLPIDVRDQRTLVIFDGFIVAGGLPRNHLHIQIFDRPSLFKRDIRLRTLSGWTF